MNKIGKYMRFGLNVLLLAATIVSLQLQAQVLKFDATHDSGNGDGRFEIRVVDPVATTGSDYSISISLVDDNFYYTIKNLNTQTVVVPATEIGEISPIFEGLEAELIHVPAFKNIIEVKYNNQVVSPPVPVFRYNDGSGQGGVNSNQSYTFVGGGGNGSLSQISRNVASATPYDYELRFESNPQRRNKFVYGYHGRGTALLADAPFSIWNIGINSPDDPSDDYQIIPIGFDDSNNVTGYDGGVTPSGGGSGTMFDRIYFYELNKTALPAGDINNDGAVDYDDFLSDLAKNTGKLTTSIFSKPYIGQETIARFSLVALNGNKDFKVPNGTIIRIVTTKAALPDDEFSFSSPTFGLSVSPHPVNFKGAIAGRTSVMPLAFHNKAASAVTITGITTTAGLSVSESAFTLNSQESKNIDVTLMTTGIGSFTGLLQIQSDDATYPVYTVPVSSKIYKEPTGDIVLRSNLRLDGYNVTDVSGYIEPTTGKEYALVGHGVFNGPPNSGLFIVDVSDAENPVKVAQTNKVTGFDIKSWKHYAYCINGANAPGQIVDLSQIDKPTVVGEIPAAHNMITTPGGYLILSNPGVRIYDLNQNPTAPPLVWQDFKGDGHDIAVINDRLYDFHGRLGTYIYDFKNPKAPVLLGTIEFPGIKYNHSGWVSKDGNYLYICDELAIHPTPDITIWDISDLSNPKKVGEYAEPGATIHNLYIIDDYAYISYYTAGFRILDISDPINPVVAGSFDSSFLTGEGYDGAFGTDPFSPSGRILVSDAQNGLFVLSFDGLKSDVVDYTGSLPDHFTLSANYPNPFNPSTRIDFTVPVKSKVELTVFNILGQPVTSLVDKVHEPGPYSVEWNGLNDANLQVPSGIYFYRLKTKSFTQTKRMILLK